MPKFKYGTFLGCATLLPGRGSEIHVIATGPKAAVGGRSLINFGLFLRPARPCRDPLAISA